jgi:hypothetical protein
LQQAGLRGHQRTGEGKAPRHRAAPVQGIALERKRPQRDGARYLATVRGEFHGVIQARHIRIGREVEVDGPGDQSPLAIGFPGTQLAAEKEGWPALTESIADMVESA